MSAADRTTRDDLVDLVIQMDIDMIVEFVAEWLGQQQDEEPLLGLQPSPMDLARRWEREMA